MRILIDIGHPAHVHLFRNFYFEMKKRCIPIIVTVKDIPSAKKLLELFSIEYMEIGEKYDSIIGKIFHQFKYDWSIFKIVKKHKINFGLGTSITLSHVSKFSKMRSFIFDDDDSSVEPLFAKFAHPFADYLISPDSLAFERKKLNHITYSGYHELAYLHPNRFTPDIKVLKELGIKENEIFFVMRFNAFKAHHDIGIKGLNLDKKRKLINLLKEKGKIFITTEKEIDPEFKRYQLKVSPEKIHSLLYYAKMFVGDSQTMTSEAAVLGTPAIKCNSFAGKLSVPNEIEKKYELCFSFLPEQEDKMIDKIKELLAMPSLKEEWQNRCERMLKDKIDVTGFMVWFVENYPESVQIMKKNPIEIEKQFHGASPEYQERFRCGTPAEYGLDNSIKHFDSKDIEKPDQDYGAHDFKPKLDSNRLKYVGYSKTHHKKKNVLVDIGHPAHVHLFRNFIKVMKKKNHKVLITVKNIPAAKELLEKYNFEYFDIGSKSDSIRGKILNQLNFDKLLYKIVKREKIDIGVGTSITLAHVSKISRMKSFIFDDDDSAVEPLFAKFAHPFTDFLISPDVLKFERRKKNHIVYPGYHELAYLHPKLFKPDPTILKDLQIKSGDTFFIFRFNVFKAHHDRGIKGLSLNKKRTLLDKLKKKGKIFITAEREIDDEFKQYQLKISPEKIHSLLYYATMFIGDSQTMTSEAAVLGTPAIRSNSFVRRISYLEEEEHKYGLTFGFKPDQFEEMMLKIDKLLALPDLKGVWAKKREKMLADKINVTAFMVWFVENYPESAEIMRENPEYQERFK